MNRTVTGFVVFHVFIKVINSSREHEGDKCWKITVTSWEDLFVSMAECMKSNMKLVFKDIQESWHLFYFKVTLYKHYRSSQGNIRIKRLTFLQHSSS